MDCDNQYTITMDRTPLSIKNVQAIKSLKKLLEKENYQIVHCHTPVASVVTRLAAQKFRKRGLKVLYTAHGFHFYTGAPLFNWLIYYPMEKYLAKFTDRIITINSEDFLRAQKKFCKSNAIYKIDGVGVDLHRFHSINTYRKLELRKNYGYKSDDFIMIYVAELNKNKNHIFLLKQVQKLAKIVPAIKIIFIGPDNNPFIKDYIKGNNLEVFVACLGFKRDVEHYYALSDICFSSSIREGLPVNIIEGMATGLPVVCSKNRGHISLIEDKVNGFLFDLRKPDEMINSVALLYKDTVLRNKIAITNINNAQRYSLEIAVDNMATIYRQFM
jgi:glycosyltransferase EpsD